MLYLCPLNHKIESTYVYNSKSNGSRLRAYSYDAKEVFPATYKDILSPEQLDYMMDWMYAPSNVRKQMEEEGHVYSIAYKENEPCGYVPFNNRKRMYSIFRRYMSSPVSGTHCGSFYSRKQSSVSKKYTRNLV